MRIIQVLLEFHLFLYFKHKYYTFIFSNTINFWMFKNYISNIKSITWVSHLKLKISQIRFIFISERVYI